MKGTVRNKIYSFNLKLRPVWGLPYWWQLKCPHSFYYRYSKEAHVVVLDHPKYIVVTDEVPEDVSEMWERQYWGTNLSLSNVDTIVYM